MQMNTKEETIGKYDKLCEELEKKEIDAPDGVPPVHVYQQLLAIYLYQNDLINAKFLWKRIPTLSKSSKKELSLIWEVGKCLWQRDFQGFYAALSKDWSPVVKHIMDDLRVKMNERAISLVSRAYTSIGVEDFAALINQSTEGALSEARTLGWTYDQQTDMIIPVKRQEEPHVPLPSEEQLRRLTEYVAFLEN